MFFANPIALWGLFSLLVPIAIHLFNFRRYRKVHFSNVALLNALQIESKKQSQLRQRMILAMRLLALTALTVAFAQPTLRPKNSHAAQGDTLVSVYIDNSYSMLCSNSEGTLLEVAKQKARQIAEAYNLSDHFQLLSSDLRGSEFRVLSHDEFLLAVDELTYSSRSTLLSTAARRQHDFLSQATEPNRHAYLITDAQRSTFDVPDLPVDRNLHSTLIPLTAEGANNIYIDSLAMTAPYYYPGATITLNVTLRNNSDRAVEKVPLRLFVNHQQRAMASVDMPAWGATTVEMSVVANQAGILNGYVETSDYPITFDDRMYFSIPIQSQLSLLTIGIENPYLRHLFANDSLTQYRFCSTRNTDYGSLPTTDLVILNQAEDLSDGLAKALLNYMEHGGTLLLIPPMPTTPQTMQQMLRQLHAPVPDQWVSTEIRCSNINYQDPLYQSVFSTTHNEDIEMPLLKGHYTLQSHSGSVSQPIITLADGTPYLSRTPYQDGQCYLFCCPLMPDYCNFMQQALFVPTLYNMLLRSHPLQPAYYTFNHTTPIMLSHPITSETIVHLIMDNDDEAVESNDIIPSIRNIGGKSLLTVYDQLTQPGCYHLTSGDTTTEGIAFNYPRTESDMQFYTLRQIKQQLSNSSLDKYYQIIQPTQQSVSQFIRKHSQGIPLWHLFVILTLIALMGEIIFIRIQDHAKHNTSL
ncbi:MAG: BatA domain-containing protein [Bacteroidales bacterium]|nr:BatA domain-containing protein [Candidatus Colimorpha onthohippi]